MQIKPFSGWMLDLSVELDRHYAGFAGAYLRGTDERRQVIAASLAMKPAGEDPIDLPERAEFLMRAQHKTILRDAFGEVPRGIRGALARSGPQPHEPKFYAVLHQTLAAPPNSTVVKTLQHTRELDLVRVRIARMLPPRLCTPMFLKTVRNVRHATQIVRMINLLRRHGVDLDELYGAARRISSPTAQNDFWHRWASKAQFPDHPLPASACYTPILDGHMLKSAARRFANCSMHYLSGCLNGRDAFGVFEHERSRCIVHLRQIDDVWSIEGVFGRNNMRPRRQAYSAFIAYAERFNIKRREMERERHGDWDVLRRLTMPLPFDVDLFDADEDQTI